MSPIPPSIRIIIPAMNAAGSLSGLLRTLQSHLSTDRIIVVDDGSSDETGNEARDAGAIVVRHPVNRGKGAALKSGVVEAFRDPDIQAVCTMDADGQHDPADAGRLMQTFLTTGADLVVGMRSLFGSGMPVERKASNVITSLLVSARTGLRIRDSQCGYRILSRRCALEAMPRTDGFEAETEWIIRTARAGMKIAWTPVRTVYGNERSHMTNWTTTKAFVRVLFQEY